MDVNDLKRERPFPSFFTTTGEDIWELDHFFLTPTAKLKNLKTGETRFFGMGGLTAQEFKRIEMPATIKS